MEMEMEKYSREKVIGLYFVYDGNGVLYLLSDRTQGTYKHNLMAKVAVCSSGAQDEAQKPPRTRYHKRRGVGMVKG